MVSIARKNLFEDLPRFLVAQAGIMLAVSLVTIQTGVLRGFTRSTTLLVEHSQADLWVGSQGLVHLELSKPLLYEQVNQVRSIKGVAVAEPLIIGSGRWMVSGGELTPLRIFGFNPQGTLFTPGNLVQGSWKALEKPFTIIIDQINLDNLNLKQIGDQAEVNSLSASLVGLVTDTQSIASSRFIFTSLETAKTYLNSGFSSELNCKLETEGVKCTSVTEKIAETTPNRTLEPISATDAITFILVKAEPDQDLEALKQQIKRLTPNTQPFTKEEMVSKTQAYWQQRTGVGFILGLGAAVGVFVGMVVVGQILYTSVTDHIREFGTLKAMGASNRLIYTIIIEQSLWMAVFGYIPGMAICITLGAWTLKTQGIMILITPATAAGVLGITVLMCVSSALFAIQKVTRVDPAIVFKA